MSRLSTTLRAFLAFSSLSIWMVCLFVGAVIGGLIHLLFVAAVVLFPWRSLRAGRG